MTRREAVAATIKHQSPGYTVWDIGCTIPIAERLIAATGTRDLDEFLGNHLTGTESSGKWEDVGGGCVRDDFGVVWDRSIDKDIGTVVNCVLERREDLATYQFPDPDDESRYATTKEYFANPRDRFMLVGIGFSMFERAWTLRGMENVLMDMVEAPEFVDELLDKILAWNLRVLHNLKEFPADGARFGDDWGSQRGVIMGPGIWRRFLKPRLAKQYAFARQEMGLPVFIHSCGDVKSIFEDIIEIGVEVFNPFQPEVMDIFEMKRLYGDRMSFFGGISTQKTLPYGTPEEVRRDVEKAIEVVGKDGGYICAPAHATPADVPVENVLAMLDVLRSQKGFTAR